MTIESAWIGWWKASNGAAFADAPPAGIDTVFIDGQLNLQCPKGLEEWDAWYACLYENTINRYLDMPGVRTVVMAFDDHLHSPLAKGPTQAARRKNTEHIEWAECLPLPPMIPADYAKLLCNKSFKFRVIGYVINRIETAPIVQRGRGRGLHLKEGQRVIIDYQNEPYVAAGLPPSVRAPAPAAPAASGPATTHWPVGEFTVKQDRSDVGKKLRDITTIQETEEAKVAAAAAAAAAHPEFCTGYIIPGTVPLGECDVKFVRYLAAGKDIILNAVDSDYVMIAMCQIERLGIACPRIFVRRLKLRVSDATQKAVNAVAGIEFRKTPAPSKKRGRDVFPEPGQHYPHLPPGSGDVPGDGGDGGAVVPVKSTRREYEYADCNMLVALVAKTFGKRTNTELKPYTVRLVAFVVALCGCDFTRGVMYFTGTAACKNAGLIWPAVCAAASIDPATGAVVMDERIIAEGVIGKMWKNVEFVKHCGDTVTKTASFETLFAILNRNEMIAERRRAALITAAHIGCLVRNCNWTVFYWVDPEKCPCAVYGGDYGFVAKAPAAGSTAKKMVVTHDDARPLALGGV